MMEQPPGRTALLYYHDTQDVYHVFPLWLRGQYCAAMGILEEPFLFLLRVQNEILIPVAFILAYSTLSWLLIMQLLSEYC